MSAHPWYSPEGDVQVPFQRARTNKSLPNVSRECCDVALPYSPCVLYVYLSPLREDEKCRWISRKNLVACIYKYNCAYWAFLLVRINTREQVILFAGNQEEGVAFLFDKSGYFGEGDMWGNMADFVGRFQRI